MTEAKVEFRQSDTDLTKERSGPRLHIVPDVQVPTEPDRQPDIAEYRSQTALAVSSLSNPPDRSTAVYNIPGSTTTLTGGYVKVVYNNKGKPIPGTGPSQ